VIIVLFAVLMVVILGFLALSIDTGMMYNVRNDLQRAVDSGALAAAQELIDSPQSVRESAVLFTRRNFVLNESINDPNISVRVGNWNSTSRVFTQDMYPLNSVQVSATQPYSPFFYATNTSENNYQIGASATAAFEPRDIMLVLDYSGSMNEGNKIGHLKRAIRIFSNLVQVSGNGRDRIGFVRYSTYANLESQLTYDLNRVTLNAESGDAEGWTNIGDGMSIARTHLISTGRTNAKKIIVLLTDGLANRPSGVNPVQYVRNEAAYAVSQNIPIISISFGADADQSLMAEVAEITRSLHFHVENDTAVQSQEIINVFRRVATNRNLSLVD
jgi:Flp pilus assembly protein TadG